jgi:hypothetical protein
MTIPRWLLAVILAAGLVLTGGVAARPQDGRQTSASQPGNPMGASYVRPGALVTGGSPNTVTALQLVPTEASPGSPVTATVFWSDCPAGDVVVAWGPGNERWSQSIDLGDGWVTATTTVPASFAAGPHEVTAECVTAESPFTLGASLTVAAPDEVTPTLMVAPTSGAAGSTATAIATGHWCDTEVVFMWDGVEVGRAVTDESGTATAPISVAADAAAGSHELAARCEYDDFPWKPAVFSVTGVATPPGSSPPGSTPPEFTSPTSTSASSASSASTSPITSGTVPTSPPGPTSAPGATTLTSSQTWEDPWWPAVAVLVALAVVSLLVLRPGHGARWARGHVRAVPGLAALAGLTPTEAPRDPSRHDISIRIEPHPDTGNRTIEEGGP